MYINKYEETAAIVNDVATHWNALMDSEHMMEIVTIGYEALTKEKMALAIALRKDIGAINIALKSTDPETILYEACTHDNSIESLSFAVDSVLEYAVKVMETDAAALISDN